MSQKRTIGTLLLLGIIGIGSCGCAPKPDVSKQDAANWKGGPVPPDFKMNVPTGPPKTGAPK